MEAHGTLPDTGDKTINDESLKNLGSMADVGRLDVISSESRFNVAIS